ncbi:hypothetical protein AB3X48_00355 [Bacillus sp. S4]|uniref:hypothetical protein n=1 Tax=Bacillus TaxID=1386 RepID=UPI00349FAF5E
MSIYIEIPEKHRRYLDMPDDKKKELEKKAKKRRRRRKNLVDYSTKLGVKEADLIIQLTADHVADQGEEKTLYDRNLHSSQQKNKKESIKTTFNGGRDLNNWDYVNNRPLN